MKRLSRIGVAALSLSLNLILTGCGNEEETANQEEVAPESINAELEMDNKLSKKEIIIKGSSNLPPNTKLRIQLYNNEGFKIEEEVEIGKSGGFESENLLETNPQIRPGEYNVELSTLPSSSQGESVRERIGEQGESLTGDLIIPSETGEKIVKVSEKVTIDVLDPTQPVPFGNGEYTVGLGEDILPGTYTVHTDEFGGNVAVFRENEPVFNEIVGTKLGEPLMFNDVEIELKPDDQITIKGFENTGVTFTPKK